MKIPDSKRRKALVIVDVQGSFLSPRNEYIVKNILSLLDTVDYDSYINATFHAEKGSLWDMQQGWTCPAGPETQTIPALAQKLKQYDVIEVSKETKSIFKGNQDVTKSLREDNIQELHIVGLDTNDCVLATAFEAFDHGFFTYVIEECCQSSASNESHENGLKILRGQDMTNNSCVESIVFTIIK